MKSKEAQNRVAEALGDMHYKNPGAAAAVSDLARTIAREEMASLAGLILRRLQLESEDFIDSTGAVVDIRLLERIFGEVLRDFASTPYEPGGKT
jgi:uncharacterized protein YdeI (BOF family)